MLYLNKDAVNCLDLNVNYKKMFDDAEQPVKESESKQK